MRGSWLAVTGLMLAASVQAQPQSIRSEPLPPLQQQWRQQDLPPGPDINEQGQQAPSQPPSQPQLGVAPPLTMDRPHGWLPATTVKLQALDKVNAQTAALTIKVGGSAAFGSLTIAAKACAVRPADQPADAAAYLTVTDSHPDSPGFDGWMLQQEPSLSMMQHPVYDLRVTGCT
jgi:hypothetical protein